MSPNPLPDLDGLLTQLAAPLAEQWRAAARLSDADSGGRSGEILYTSSSPSARTPLHPSVLPARIHIRYDTLRPQLSNGLPSELAARFLVEIASTSELVELESAAPLAHLAVMAPADQNLLPHLERSAPAQLIVRSDPLGLELRRTLEGESKEKVSRPSLPPTYPRAQVVSPFAVDGASYAELGFTEAEELSFALMCAVEYLRYSYPEQLGPLALYAELSVAGEFISVVAKLRAFRALWQQLERLAPPLANGLILGGRDPVVGKSQLAEIDVLRSIHATIAAHAGGADVLPECRFGATRYADAQSAGAAEDRENVDRRTKFCLPLIIADELSVGRVDDPFRGSYAVEALTAELVAEGWSLCQEIDEAGGIGTYVESARCTARYQAARRRTAAARGVSAISPAQLPSCTASTAATGAAA